MKSIRKHRKAAVLPKTLPPESTNDDRCPPLFIGPSSNKDHAPTQEQLTLFAAVVAQGTNIDPQKVVEYAFALWNAASEKLKQAEESSESEMRQIGQMIHDETCGGELDYPTSFPASLDQFLRLAVDARTTADSTKRLRDFLISKFPDNESFAIEELAKMRRDGFPTKESWLDLGDAYVRWWIKERSKKAAESAHKRKKG